MYFLYYVYCFIIYLLYFIQYLYYFINDFTLTFDQVNELLLNRIIISVKKKEPNNSA